MTDLELKILEIISVSFNLAFIFFLSKEKRWSWPFGIVGSITGALLFYKTGYFSEGLLYLFYTVVGFYGWLLWTNADATFSVKRLKAKWHILWIFIGALATVFLGRYMKELKADKPFYDAFSSVFGVIATFLEMYKYIGGWVYWIVLNLYSIGLYAVKGLWMYSAQMVIFTLLSFYGFKKWQLALQKG